MSLLFLASQTLHAASGIVVAWGDTSFGQSTVPDRLSDVVAVAGGGYAAGSHSLALKGDGSVVGWGGGMGPFTSGAERVPIGLRKVVAIAAGRFHSLALQDDGTVAAWGSNSDGQLVVPGGLTNVVSIGAGASHSLAVRMDGTVVSWGYSQYGLSVPDGLSGVTAVAGGDTHTLALRGDGTVIAWGANFSGQTNVPADLTNAVAVAAGSRHSVALKSDGSIVAWGDNSFGLCTVPSGLSNAVAIAVQGTHNLALRNDGVVVAWGENAFGETTVPNGIGGVVTVAAGCVHSLAVVGLPPAPAGSLSRRRGLFGTNVQLDGAITNAPAFLATPTGYQWRLNGTNLTGVSGPTLVVTNFSKFNSGLYTVAVSNTSHGVLSAMTYVELVVPQRWQSPIQDGNGQLRLQFGAADGSTLTQGDLGRFEIHTTPDLNATNWAVITPQLTLTNGMAQFDSPASPSNTRRFYRVIER